MFVEIGAMVYYTNKLQDVYYASAQNKKDL